jgi:transcriptional regulator with XRE-family HTH domain
MIIEMKVPLQEAGRLFRAVRKSRGLNLEQVSQLMGQAGVATTMATISNFEASGNITHSRLIALFNVLGLRPEVSFKIESADLRRIENFIPDEK